MEDTSDTIRVNIFDYEKVEVCGGTRLRRKVTGRQQVFTLRKKGIVRNLENALKR